MDEKNIDIKNTFSTLINEELPEMTQEEAIKNYREDNTIAIPKKGAEDSEDNTEESEHLKRIKKELLASLERVKVLAKKIFGEETIKSKKITEKEKKSKQQTKEKVQDKEEKNIEKDENIKER